MRRLVFFVKFSCLLRIPVSDVAKVSVSFSTRMESDLRSPSEDLANIHVSPDFFPKREPSGSVLTMCSIAFPTSPAPPVTSTTVDIVPSIDDAKMM